MTLEKNRGGAAASTAPLGEPLPTPEELLSKYLQQAGSDQAARKRAAKRDSTGAAEPSQDLAQLFDGSPVSARWATTLRGGRQPGIPRWVTSANSSSETRPADPLRELLKRQLWKNFQMAQAAKERSEQSPSPSPQAGRTEGSLPPSAVHVVSNPLPRPR